MKHIGKPYEFMLSLSKYLWLCDVVGCSARQMQIANFCPNTREINKALELLLKSDIYIMVLGSMSGASQAKPVLPPETQFNLFIHHLDIFVTYLSCHDCFCGCSVNCRGEEIPIKTRSKKYIYVIHIFFFQTGMVLFLQASRTDEDGDT